MVLTSDKKSILLICLMMKLVHFAASDECSRRNISLTSMRLNVQKSKYACILNLLCLFYFYYINICCFEFALPYIILFCFSIIFFCLCFYILWHVIFYCKFIAQINMFKFIQDATPKERNSWKRTNLQHWMLFRARVAMMKLVHSAAGDECSSRNISLTSISDLESDDTFKDICFLNKLKKDSISILNQSIGTDESDYDL